MFTTPRIFVCLPFHVQKPCFPVDWRLLCEECIANIGIPLAFMIFCTHRDIKCPLYAVGRFMLLIQYSDKIMQGKILLFCLKKLKNWILGSPIQKQIMSSRSDQYMCLWQLLMNFNKQIMLRLFCPGKIWPQLSAKAGSQPRSGSYIFQNKIRKN